MIETDTRVETTHTLFCDDPVPLTTPEHRDRARVWWDDTLAKLRDNLSTGRGDTDAL